MSARIEADASSANTTIENTEEKSKIAARSIVSNLRRAAQFGMLLATATGGALNRQYTLAIEAALVTLDTVIAMQAAVAAGTFGVGTAIQGAASAISVILMIRAIQQLRQGKAEQAAQTQQVIQVFRVMSLTRFFVSDPVILMQILVFCIWVLVNLWRTF